MLMKKKVDVYPILRPIHTIHPPILRTAIGITLGIGDIQACICGHAIVEEVLNDGSRLRLDFTNYDKDNNKLLGIEQVANDATPVINEVVEETQYVSEPQEEIIEQPQEVVEETQYVSEPQEEIIEQPQEVVEEEVQEEQKGKKKKK